MAPATIKITLACAYCLREVTLRVGDISLRNKKGHALRSDRILIGKCPHCDSTFTVHVDTKRKSRGKRRLAQEAEAKAKEEAVYRAAQERNNALGAELLAQPGCTCAAEIERDKERYGRQGRTMGREGDHPLVPSWTNGLPNEPTHRYGCPLRTKGAA